MHQPNIHKWLSIIKRNIEIGEIIWKNVNENKMLPNLKNEPRKLNEKKN